jgi:hypothetical protein
VTVVFFTWDGIGATKFSSCYASVTAKNKNSEEGNLYASNNNKVCPKFTGFFQLISISK